MLIRTLLLIALSAICTGAAAMLTVVPGNAQYGEIIDKYSTLVDLYATIALDCTAPPDVFRAGNQFTITAHTSPAAGQASAPCYFNRGVDLGTLSRGYYGLKVIVVDRATGSVVDTTSSQFYVRPLNAACNRFPSEGSIVNVWRNGMNGDGIAAMIASDPVLAAALGNPVVSLTLYNNAGAQLVYPAPEDPLPHVEQAKASGAFTAVGSVQGYTSGFPEPPPDVVSPVVEYHNNASDAYFYATSAPEIANLDRTASGWARTGYQFNAVTHPASELNFFQVYRFVGVAGRGPSTHFFTVDQEECFGLYHGSVWQYEGVAFYANRPLMDGSCSPTAGRPLFRLWRPFGESRHRLTIDASVVESMMQQGWVAEGASMCVAR